MSDNDATTDAAGPPEPDPEPERIAELARRAAHVQDLLGDLEAALVQNGDAIAVLSDFKVAWREFRKAAIQA